MFFPKSLARKVLSRKSISRARSTTFGRRRVIALEPLEERQAHREQDLESRVVLREETAQVLLQPLIEAGQRLQNGNGLLVIRGRNGLGQIFSGSQPGKRTINPRAQQKRAKDRYRANRY